MNFKLLLTFIISLTFILNLHASEKNKINEPLFKPFIERYILDEIKELRQDLQQMQADVEKKIVNAKLESSDRVMQYTVDTTNNIFYIITATASILVLLGWKSLRDIKNSIESITTNKILELTNEYEERLNQIESKMRERSEQIIAAQEKIANTNHIHALWMRAGLEKSEQEKINIYDQILDLNSEDVEALTYKADALLEIGEAKWALSLTDEALKLDENYSLAHWQRACAKAELGYSEEAIDEIEEAVKISQVLVDSIEEEKFFDNLKESERFKKLLSEYKFR